VPLHAPSLCGVWNNGNNPFVVFYICPDYWTIIDPIQNVTSPNPTLSDSIAITWAVTYLDHGIPDPPPHPFKRVNWIAIQNDSPQAPWLCKTIAILTILHPTLGHIWPDKTNKASIGRRQYLTFHQTLLHLLILGTPPNFWNLNYINTNIIQGDPIHISEHNSDCGSMQSLSLTRGTSPTPHHRHHIPAPSIHHDNTNPVLYVPNIDSIQAPIFKRPSQSSQEKLLTSKIENCSPATPPSHNKPHKEDRWSAIADLLPRWPQLA